MIVYRRRVSSPLNGSGQASPARDQAAAGRIDWIDAARGIGIILVVYGHVMRGLVVARLIPADAFFRQGDTLIYAFHMSLFFVLSGLFARAARRRGARPFLWARIRTLAYPYLLWSLVQGVTTLYAGHLAQHGLSWQAIASILWQPIGQFWFLHALFLCNLALLPPGRWTLLAITLAGAVTVMAAGGGNALLIAANSLVAFSAGAYLGSRRASALLATPGRAAAVAAGGWFGFALLMMIPATSGHLAPWLLGWLRGIAGTLGACGIARLCVRWAPVLVALGQASMAIYLLHVMAVAAIRVAMEHSGARFGEPAWIVALTLGGLAIPYAAQRIAARLGIENWLGFGADRRGPSRLGGGALRPSEAVA